jgi:hypothetical protein
MLGVTTVTNSIRAITVLSLVSALFCTSASFGATACMPSTQMLSGLCMGGLTNVGTACMDDTVKYECNLDLEGTQYGYDQVIGESSDEPATSDIVDLLGLTFHSVTLRTVQSDNHAAAPTAVAPTGSHSVQICQAESKASMPAPGGLLLLGLSTGSVGWIRRRQIA